MDAYTEICRKAVPILKPCINRLAVFGSTMRRETTAKSDLDLVISLKPSGKRPKLGLFKLLEIEEALEKRRWRRN